MDLARFLVEHGADTTAKDMDELTPLSQSVSIVTVGLTHTIAVTLPRTGQLRSIWRRLYPAVYATVSIEGYRRVIVALFEQRRLLLYR